MNRWHGYLLGLAAGLVIAVAAQAQPAAPPAPGAVAVATAAAPTKNIWSFLCMTPDQKTNCKACWCKSAFGQISSNMLKPMTAMTGGLIKDKCALPLPADLAKPADSADGAAARIKQDEAEALQRRMSVRYLGTVDCSYWPEAEDALINALRGDRNECVRLEAAVALARGCCCTAKTVEALTNTVIGTDKDGFPPEKSERVKAAAAEAIAACPLTVPAGPESLPVPKEGPKKTRVNPSEYYKAVGSLSRDQALENSRLQLSHAAAPQKRPEGVFGIIAASLAAPSKGKDYSAVSYDMAKTPASPEPARVPVATVPAPAAAVPTKVAPAAKTPVGLPPVKAASHQSTPAARPQTPNAPAAAPQQPQGLLQMLNRALTNRRSQTSSHELPPAILPPSATSTAQP